VGRPSVREPVEAVPQVAHEAMALTHHPRAAELLEAADTPRPPFEVLVITLDPLLLHFARDVLRLRHNRPQRRRIRRRLVRRDAAGPRLGPCGRLLKEGRGCCRIACLAQVHVNHLALFVDGPIGVDPAAGQPI